MQRIENENENSKSKFSAQNVSNALLLSATNSIFSDIL
jgi:hypothetical protein